MALNERCPNTSWQCRRNRNSPSRQIIATRRSQSPDSETEQNTKNQWELGEIAFLKKADHFTKGERETLLDSQNVRDKATGHPVIILDRSPDRKLYVITTVSAYKSDRRNDYLPPWKQNCHFQKDEWLPRFCGIRETRQQSPSSPPCRWRAVAQAKNILGLYSLLLGCASVGSHQLRQTRVPTPHGSGKLRGPVYPHASKVQVVPLSLEDKRQGC